MDTTTARAFIDELVKIARSAAEAQDIFAAGGAPEYAAMAGPQLAPAAEKKKVVPPRPKAATEAAVATAAAPAKRVVPPRPGMAGSVFEAAAVPEEAKTLLTAGYLPPEMAEAATPAGLRRASVGGAAAQPVRAAVPSSALRRASLTEEAAKALMSEAPAAEKTLLQRAVPAVTEAVGAAAHNPAVTHGAAGLAGLGAGFAAGRATAPAARAGMGLLGKGAIGAGLVGAGLLGGHLLSRPQQPAQV